MRLRRPALSFLLLTGLSLGALSPARAAEDPAPARHDGVLKHALARHLADDLAASEDHVPSSARDELAEVRELFEPKTEQPDGTDESDGTDGTDTQPTAPALPEDGDATLPLRDLAIADPGAAGRNANYATYQRPWADNDHQFKKDCAANICVHWLSKDNPKYASNPNASTDSYAHTALLNLAHVSDVYTKAHYRTPKPDAARPDGQPMYGGSDDTDVYLADVGSRSLYGYCTVDRNDDGTFTYAYQDAHTRRSDLPAFCVLDNDYAKSQFGTRRSALDNLRVTAAHEYFHAVQFAYDFLEDRWFMEATATWAEDEVYDGINDNVQYLRTSQLRYPGKSLDDNNALGGMLHYGDWLYFRFLTERLPAKSGDLPSLVRQMWERADTVKGPDQFSIQAVNRTLAAHKVSFPTMFAKYAAANRHPATAYSEGRANHYPKGRPKRTAPLKPSKRKATGSIKVDHLASATVRFVPKRMTAKRRLLLSVNMADKSTGSVAVALVYYKNGRVGTRMIRLNRAGNGKTRVPFATRSVRAVELTLVNANMRYKRCSNNVGGFSCGGVPVRNQVNEKYSATVR